eukprot:g5436.t1
MLAKFKVNNAKAELCSKEIDESTAEKFRQAVRSFYWYQLSADDLPMWGMVGEVMDEKEYIFSHRSFEFLYNGEKIVQVNLKSQNPVLIESGAVIDFSYSVVWKPTKLTFKNRFERYLDFTFFEHSIHWFSVFNSFMMVVFLCGLVALILIRTLKSDYKAYNIEEKDIPSLSGRFTEEPGWKQVSGDVFRAPRHLELFSILWGTGHQIFCLVLLVTLLGIPRELYSDSGATTTAIIVFYCLTSFINGYSSGGFYKRHSVASRRKGTTRDLWKITMVGSAALLPGIFAIVGLLLNCLICYNGHTNDDNEYYSDEYQLSEFSDTARENSFTVEENVKRKNGYCQNCCRRLYLLIWSILIVGVAVYTSTASLPTLRRCISRDGFFNYAFAEVMLHPRVKASASLLERLGFNKPTHYLEHSWNPVGNSDRESVVKGGKIPLHHASIVGNYRMVKLLLRRGAFATLNTKSEHGATPLILAALNGHDKVVFTLIKNGANLYDTWSSSHRKGLNAGHWAARGGHIDVVKELFANGYDLYSLSSNGNNILYYATESGSIELIEFLVDACNEDNEKIDALFNGKKGLRKDRPIHVAIRNRYWDIVRLLVSYKVDLDSPPLPVSVALQLPTRGETFTQEEGDIVELLIKNASYDFKSSEASSEDSYLNIWLHLLSKSGFGGKYAAKLLLSIGADSQSVQESSEYQVQMKKTVLITAIQQRHFEIGSIFLKHMTSVKNDRGNDILLMKDTVGRTALHNIVLHMNSMKGKNLLNELLLEGGEKLAAIKARDGKTALHIAAWTGRLDAVQRLLKVKGNIKSLQCKKGRTPIHWASDHGHLEIVKVLVRAGVDPLQRTRSGLTILHILSMPGGAEEDKKLKVMHWLLAKSKLGEGVSHILEARPPITSHGSSSKRQKHIHVGMQGNTALHIASRSVRVKTVQMLLDFGAKVDARTESEETALHLAASSRRVGNTGGGEIDSNQIIISLLKAGADIDAVSKYGETALIRAAESGRFDVVKNLLQQGATIELETNNGQTAQSIASERKYRNIYLLIGDYKKRKHEQKKVDHL